MTTSDGKGGGASLKKYLTILSNFGAEMMESDEGEWVKYDDVATTIAELRAQVEKLQREAEVDRQTRERNGQYSMEVSSALKMYADEHLDKPIPPGENLTTMCLRILHSQVEGLRERVKCEAAEVDAWRRHCGPLSLPDKATLAAVISAHEATNAARLAAKGEKLCHRSRKSSQM